MSPSFAVFSRVAVLVCLCAGPALSGCGGFDPGLSVFREPRLALHEWLRGPRLGRLLALDRNGNLQEAGRILRQCAVAPEGAETGPLSGSCRDRIEYSYGAPTETRTLRWKMRYQDDIQATVQFAYEYAGGGPNGDEAGSETPSAELHGRAYGQLIVLEGEQRIPGGGASDGGGKRATSRIRLYALPGEGQPALQIEEYTWLGFQIGRAEIFWEDRAAP